MSRTYGKHKNLPGIYFPFFISNIWSYLLWSPVIGVWLQFLSLFFVLLVNPCRTAVPFWDE